MLLLTCALSAHETGGTCCLVNKKRRGCAACSKNTQSLPHASSIKFDVHNELHTARYGLFYAKPTSPKLHSMFMQQDVCGICYSVDIQRLSSCFFFFSSSCVCAVNLSDTVDIQRLSSCFLSSSCGCAVNLSRTRAN